MDIKMLDRVKKTISEYNMIVRGDAVCCAFSGGADSTALLLCLKELSEELSFSVSAVHINHMLRGEESDGDERFCAEICEKYGIPLRIFRKDAAGYSRALGMSEETGAREMRYEIFNGLIADGFASRVATAHNLNDNTETILFRLARGTGLKGLCGIPPVRDRFIRPLIECSRKEIENFLKEKNESYVTDSTNLSDKYSRNRIRLRIMPEMTAVHGGFPENISRTVNSLSEDEGFILSEAEAHKNDDLRTLHPALRKRIIINFLRSHKLEMTAARAEEINSALTAENGKNINADGNRLIQVKNGRLYLSEKTGEKIVPDPLNIEKEGVYPFSSDRFVIISKVNGEKTGCGGIVHKNLTTTVLDYDKIQGGILLRNRYRNDRIRPAGAAHTKELRKILQERLPKDKRGISAVLADSMGVFWSECAGIADRVRPDKNTKTFMIIEVKYSRPL